MLKSKYDVVILGTGHNGLVRAVYLARAGLSVMLLEKNDYIGGGGIFELAGDHTEFERL